MGAEPPNLQGTFDGSHHSGQVNRLFGEAMLSVLIVNWNTKDLLLKCLDSLIEHPPECDMEVVVVDNASSDGSAEALDEWQQNWIDSTYQSDRSHRSSSPGSLAFYLIRSTTNTGYARGNNIAFEQAKGEWLLTLNPDTEVFAGSLQRALDTLARREDCGALGARQVSVDGSTQRSVRGFPSLSGILGALIGVRTGVLGSYELAEFDYDTEQLCPQPMGTFLLFRREALTTVGPIQQPFDERFPIFFNEVDLLYRLKKAGWNCVYDPHVRVLHHGGESTKQIRPKMVWESHRSLIRYLKKHALRWWNAPIYGIVFAVIWLGALARTRTIDVGFRP
jgi:GT2 family glycosyltransferase